MVVYKPQSRIKFSTRRHTNATCILINVWSYYIPWIKRLTGAGWNIWSWRLNISPKIILILRSNKEAMVSLYGSFERILNIVIESIIHCSIMPSKIFLKRSATVPYAISQGYIRPSKHHTPYRTALNSKEQCQELNWRYPRQPRQGLEKKLGLWEEC